MPALLLKTEPSTYSFADLERDRRTAWTGVSNAAALGFLRTVRAGDELFIYHTGDDKHIAGLAKALGTPYADPDRPGTNARGELAFPVIDIAPVKSAKTPLALASMKSDARFAGFELLRQPRLSVVPVPAELAKLIRTLSGL